MNVTSPMEPHPHGNTTHNHSWIESLKQHCNYTAVDYAEMKVRYEDLTLSAGASPPRPLLVGCTRLP